MRTLSKLLALSVILLISCQPKDPASETDNLFKFKDYIHYNTYGNKSITTPIEVVLASPLENFELNQEIENKYLKITPNTSGKLIIENQRKLRFQPNEMLQPDTEYTVSVLLNKLYPSIPKEFKKYTFSFKTLAPNFKLNLDQLQSYSKNWQYVTGTLESADLIALDKAKQLLEASQNNKDLKIEWNNDDGLSQFFSFTIDSIQRLVEDTTIDIRWDGKPIKSKFKGSQTFPIPGQNNFTIVDAKATAAPNALLRLNFSDPLQENQNFSGLITIEKAQNLRFEVDGNSLNIYPENRITGDVRVTVFNGIKNQEGYGLKQEFSELISFEELKPAVKLVSQGVILPNANTTPLYFEAVNLSAVDVRVIKVFEDNVLQYLQGANLNDRSWYNLNRVGRRIAKKTILLKDAAASSGSWKSYGINLSEYFNTDPGALYRIEISFKKEYSTYSCTTTGTPSEENTEDYFEEDITLLDNAEADALEEQYWDNEIYNYRNNRYNWRERKNPCHEAYYNDDRVVRTNVLGSDLGFIVKESNNKAYHFATTNLLTAQPEAGVTIKLYNYQQQVLGSTTTNQEGLALFDANKDVAFAVANKGSNYAYAKLNDGNALSLSNFDVSGKKLQKGLKGFLYTERGVHRPGDSIHLTFVLNDNANPLPKNHPVKLSLKDARGKLVQQTVLSSNSGNSTEGSFYYFPIATQSTAPTGNWRASIQVGGANFSKTLKVATIKPNRLKIALDFEDEIVAISKPIIGSAQVNWLHGAPARNLRVEMQTTISSSNSAFPKFSKYNFNDPVREFNKVELPFIDKKLTEEGTLSFNEEIDINGKAPGMLQATFLTKAYEGGGDFSIDVFSKKLAPYSHFVGLKSPEPHRYGSYFTDENVTFNLVTLDAQGKTAASRNLQVQVFKIEWRWWWNRGYDNLSRYENASVHRPFSSFNVTTKNDGKGTFKVNIPEDEGGRFLIRVIDKKSGHATGKIVYFYRNWWNRPVDNDAESAKMLLFSADKEKYEVGESAQITFPSSSEGRALVSVENGTEVLSTQWIETQKGETTVQIPLTEEMAPNVYINIALLQPHQQTQNNLPIRLYGVVPILVENPSTILNPTLKIPEVIQPESNYEITVSETNKKAMTYTLAVVDEGLLDLTRFKTPQIHEAFYSREALGVKTFDIFDDVIGAYSGSVENIFAIGGGDAAAGAKNRKADRFKPVVSYLGPFQLKAGEKQSHTLKMGNYVGSVRAMVIAGNTQKNAYGKVDAIAPVRKPLMVLASLPRKLSPGEIVTLPVTVFAMEPKVKNATIKVQTGASLKPISGNSKMVSFDKPGEKIVNFDFEVLPTDRFETIKITASGGGEKANYTVEIDVENPNPISQKTTVYTLAENDTQTLSFETFGVAGSNAATLEFSTLPPMNFDRRLEYLIRYPHGCIEQTTSSVFPQLHMDAIFDITLDKKKQIERNIQAAIRKLERFQRPDGGLSYWPGERGADDWGTNYAGHFMIEAKQKGYALPISFLDNWLRYQKNAARQWRNSAYRYNSGFTQAYRLYTLALAGHPELAAMNRLRESKGLSNNAKWRLAAAYALAGKKQVAQDIIQTANILFQPQEADYYTYGSPFRNKSMALETLVLLEDPKQRDLSISLAKQLASRKWYSTQETAYALLSLAKMVQKNGGKSMELTYTNNGNTQTVKTDRALATRNLNINTGVNEVTAQNRKGNTVYVTVSQKGKLPLGEELTERKNLSVTTRFVNQNNTTVNVSNLLQGSEITAEITVSNDSSDFIGNIALSQIFPSGWEIVNTSFTDLEGGATGNARYTDIRDDRVNFYFDLSGNTSKTFTVRLNASYLGTYYLPGTQVEAMYDNSYYARNKGQWITVKQ